ncbi:MAG: hypothetical protein M1837_004925 [Sclerophora amabilis]|nr:MAG: hypothetical protein M1837_004925 [Sclerophora amabilis]
MAVWNDWLELTSSPYRELDISSSSSFLILMASSEVDQKYLGRFAKITGDTHSYLSGMLFKVLGLSVRLSRKLVKARRHRKLDPTRDTKSLQLYHHIIWLSREGLVMIEQYVIPMAAATSYNELKVLSYKLRASFYHIYVLFHNNPPITQAVVFGTTSAKQSASDHSNPSGKGKAPAKDARSSLQSDAMNGGPVGGSVPPGLEPLLTVRDQQSRNFLVPSRNYIPTASSCFNEAVKLSDELLYGSHPIRLSVKLEYAAFTYDCVKDAEGSRLISKLAIADVLSAQEAMDDEMFDDSAELVKILGKMMKRGTGNTPGSTSGGGSSSTPVSKTTPKTSTVPTPAVPSPGMANPI